MMETNSNKPKRSLSVSILSHPMVRTVAKLLLIALGYFVFARVGSFMHPEGFAAMSTASGFGLAVLLLNRQRDWPGILLASLAAVMLANVLSGFTIVMSLAIAGANTVESLLAAWILVRYRGKPVRFTHISEVIALIVGVVILSNSLTSFLGAAVSYFGLGVSFWTAWRVWLLSDGLRMLLVTPFIVLWVTQWRENMSELTRSQLVELCVVIGLMFAGVTYLFLFVPRNISDAFLYLLYPFIVWIAFRFKPVWTVTVLLVLAIFAILYTYQDLGPFHDSVNPDSGNLLVTQVFFGVAASFGLLFAQVVTQHKEAEEQLRIAEQNFRNSLDDSPMGCRIYSRYGNLLYANQALLEIYGYESFEEFKSTTKEDRLTRKGLGTALRGQEALAQGKPMPSRYEFSIVRKDGQVRYLSAIAKPVQWNGENQTQILYQDITEQRKGEESLKESEGKLRSVLMSSPDLVFVFDEEGVFTSIHSDAEKTYLPPEVFVGKSYSQVLPPHVTILITQAFDRNKNGELAELEYHLEIGGEIKWYSAKLSPIMVDGRFSGSVAVCRNITERKKAEEQLRISEEKFRSLFRSIPIPTYTWKHQEDDFILVDYNEAAELITEGKISNLIGAKANDLYRDNPQILSYIRRCFQLKASFETEIDYQFVDTGAVKTLNVKHAFVHPDLIMIHAEDISERKLAEETIRSLEERFRNLFDSAPVGIVSNTVSGNIIDANKTLLKMLGYDSKEEFQTSAISGHYHDPKDREAWLKLLQERGRIEGLEVQLKRKDGTLFWASFSSLHQEFTSGELQFITVVQDITHRKLVEEALRESEERFRKVFEAGPLGMALVSLDYRFIQVNLQFCKMMGYSEAELISRTFSHIRPAENIDNDAEEMARLLQGELYSYQTEKRYIRKDKEEIWGNLTRTVIRDKEGNPLYFLGVVEDITKRKKAEETLKLQAEMLDLESDSVDLHDFEGNILYANRAFYTTLGYTREEVFNMHLNQLDDQASAKIVPARLRELSEKGKATFNVNHHHKNGSLIPLEVHASLIEFGGRKLIVSVAHDISESQKIQQQLMAQDRLASIGQLVSGVAHELSNQLSGIVLYSELLQQGKLPDDVTADLKVIIDEAQRAVEIVKDLLTFARRQPEGKTEVQINEHIERVLVLRNHEQKVNNIQVNICLDPDLPEILGNSTQVQQVFFNIIINAEQAMLGAGNKGVLTITTERMGDKVKASFSDDGPGISPENMKRLFTPFFTTKEVGKGTGLGLSICHGIVTEHGGRIYAESEAGKGATFNVELPVCKVPASE